MYAARCFPPHAAHTLGMDHVTCIDQSDAGTKMPQCCGVHATVQPSWPCEMWKHYLLQWHHFCHFFVPPHYVVVQKSWQKRWHPRINASTFHMAMTQDSVIICGGAKKMAKTTPPQSVTLLCLYALSHDRALWSADLFNEKKHKLYLKSWSWLADAKYVIKKFTKKIIKVCVTKDNRFYFSWSHP